jgi:hypothetical protein
MRNAYMSVGKPGGKRPFQIYIRRWKITLIVCMWTGISWLRIRSSGELLRTVYSRRRKVFLKYFTEYSIRTKSHKAV